MLYIFEQWQSQNIQIHNLKGVAQREASFWRQVFERCPKVILIFKTQEFWYELSFSGYRKHSMSSGESSAIFLLLINCLTKYDCAGQMLSQQLGKFCKRPIQGKHIIYNNRAW